jgi:hypothetical protein
MQETSWIYKGETGYTVESSGGPGRMTIINEDNYLWSSYLPQWYFKHNRDATLLPLIFVFTPKASFLI